MSKIERRAKQYLRCEECHEPCKLGQATCTKCGAVIDWEE